MRQLVWLFSLAFVLSLNGMDAHAQSGYAAGVKLYEQRNYRAAAAVFEKIMASEPNNANAFYYAALACQQMGDLDRARNLYKVVVEKFPASRVAQYAKKELQALLPLSEQQSGQTSSSSASGQGNLNAPEQSTIYFTKSRGNLYVDAFIDENPIKMVFDTGASVTMLGKNHLDSLGIEPPEGPPVGTAAGVGGSGTVRLWTMRVDLTVGDITRRNFPITVAERREVPLLGETFFNEFTYTINEEDQSISLARKNSSYAEETSSYVEGYAVPFTVEGNEMVVTARVNGRPYKMYFDTGAAVTVFSMGDLQKLQISVPPGATAGIASGIGGQSRSVQFPIDRLSLGPIEKYDFSITAVESTTIPRPLLGQTFYSGWEYTIDNKNKVIRLVRQ